MDQKKSVRDVQEKILEIMKYIDKLCRAHDITYFIMGGTALGAVRLSGICGSHLRGDNIPDAGWQYAELLGGRR